ncbi:cystathionine gamma-synthase [Rubrivirga sp. S365]|uniref:Cystathionine gamma-synthase n=1 Tax=Rubrivirga litoralis TaxID=3075598 RepID=A0ABU3BUY6_9BACT|nr:MULTISPECIES: cystathionine gamma-synthase [unclassified Rubrivirga]MDT0633098.1 cystathionine gamma-synthase [Rubrivirga sp. F394]MDT7857860.1 cystathionine gamma-synthase [Rubrivirga sp. S365]
MSSTPPPTNGAHVVDAVSDAPPDALGSPEADLGFGTRAIHAGQAPDPTTGAIMTPVYLTSTYVQEAPDVHKGYDYARVGNPTRTALEANLASLEGAAHGVAFASGVAGIDAILRRLRPGDHVVSTNDLYGGTYRLMRQVWEPFGVEFTFVDLGSPDDLDAAITDATKLVWIETPTNPLLRVYDIAALCDVAHACGVDVAVDNTFASPYLQTPLALGADLVLHSTTKYLGGHSDVVGGAVLTSSDEWADHLRFQIKAAGAAPGPLDCFLLLRATKTLHLRMERHCQNARAVAHFLRGHDGVARVMWPGFEDHPAHDVAARQMRDFGGMVSLVLEDDEVETAVRFMQALRVFSLAESLGGVESLVSHPSTMTHGSIPGDVRRAAGLPDSLVRLSVGVEDEADLVADLDRALASL